ncbi:MAG TPA: complex I subunit 1 family protein, partial [Planctomycetaceae bacterium]|nr:complex I subunit 1 family protein [Planctomycetaceae bacterium]
MTSFPLATIGEHLESVWGLSPFWVLLISAVVHVAFVLLVFGVVPVVWIWGERKIAGRIQDRLGPTRVGGKFGWLQSFADGIKLIQKEDLVPSAADSMLFRMAPYMVCIASLAAFVFLPFADGWVAVASDIALYALVAILSLEVIGVIFAGYSSGSKWSLFGGMREAAQMVSYEIPLAICAIIPITIAGTLNLSEISQLQSGWLGNWFLFHNPFVFITFFVYFTVATASCKRAPFDLAEAESELVGGFHTEYSGMRWSFFFLGEYAAMFVVCAVAAILFLGGWNTGIGPLDSFLVDLRATSAGQSGFVLESYLANVLGMV